MFEAHITVSTEHSDQASIIAVNLGWKTSQIARDPELGDGTNFYLTKHDKSYARLSRIMQNAVSMLRRAQIPVLRQKIEAIIHDSKNGDGDV